jgi:hypothetical protein
MNHFVPSGVETAGNHAAVFDSWFQTELKSYWEEAFGEGVLVLKLPPELCVAPYHQRSPASVRVFLHKNKS